ncbi:unnamed protein product, partial [Mesorhabditis spiculigera]
MNRLSESIEDDWNYYSLSKFDLDPANYTADDYISSVVVFDGGNLYLTRTSTRIYGGVSLVLTLLVLALRLFIFPHLLFESLRSFCFTSLSLLFISVAQIIQNFCQLYHGYLMVQAFMHIPLMTTYSCPIMYAAWLLQSLLYLTVVPATVIQSIGSKKFKARTVFLIYLTICLILSIAFFGINYPGFGQSVLYFDIPMWMVNGYNPLPLTGFSLKINHILDIVVAGVMIVFLVLLAAACPFAGSKTPNMGAIRKEVFWTSVYFCITTGISLGRDFFIMDSDPSKSKDWAAICYLGTVVWGLGKPIIYMFVHRKSLCFRKIMP